ncbi:MAG TPA: murein L,D-transpeptidase catalytic domain family protein [Longimicrobiales bacterium]|nr:murein L,D-transpeptidase catalytic domain family protein [Longimicrobiales bacterium]
MARMLLLASLLGWLTPASMGAASAPTAAVVTEDPAEALYREVALAGMLESAVFVEAYRDMERHGLQARMLAIADMTQPSTAKRLFVLDLEERTLVLRTWVAHGQNSGELMAERFSNRDGSHQTSLGLYRVGADIVSPKHGRALLLHGLDQGVNDGALRREVIIHGADYVSAEFIAAHGRLGRSWGCPAVPRDDMARVIELLADDGLLYVAGA